MECIYIPLIEKELPHLEFLSYSWRLFPPFSKKHGNHVDLIISFDIPPSSDTVDHCRALFSAFGFSQVKVISADLTAAEAVYHRGPVESGLSPKYGYKSGPNLHWLYNQRYTQGKYSWVLQNEVDMFPLGANWYDQCRSGLSDAWVMSGAIYRGPTRLGPRLWHHINGNAFYQPAHPLHAVWVDLTERSLLYFISQGDRHVAFDVAVFQLISLFFGANSLGVYAEFGSSLPDEDALRALISTINYNDRIWNFSGAVEMRLDYQVHFDQERSRYGTNALLVHSSCFRYWILQELLKNEIIFSTNEKMILIRYLEEFLFSRSCRSDAVRNFVQPNKELRWALSRSFVLPGLWASD